MTQSQRALVGDGVAGISVALIAIPQALAYADLAGLPAWHGLYAVATAPIFAALFASSRYLQTGPAALTALMTFGALSQLAQPSSSSYVALAALLALVVGVTRVAIGVARGGTLAYLMSRPVIHGFTVGAALLILVSALPAAMGVAPAGGSVLGRALHAFAHPGAWQLGAWLLSAATLALMFGGRRIHPLFPGVLVAAALGLAAGYLDWPVGPAIGAVPAGLPTLSLDLPWHELPRLLLPGVVIAVVGFAESTAISRAFAAADREAWSPHREFVSQGVANLAAGLFGGFPVGGSFARSSLAREAGARTRLAGAIAGVTVIAILPWADRVAPLPRAILGSIVIGAVIRLIRFQPFVAFWRQSRLQALIAWTTLAATLAAAPHIEYGVICGVALSLAVHLWREMAMHVDATYQEGTLELRPMGVLWFGSAPSLRAAYIATLAQHPQARALVLDFQGLGRIDLSGADALQALVDDTRTAGIAVRFANIPPHARRIIQALFAELAAEALPKDGDSRPAPRR